MTRRRASDPPHPSEVARAARKTVVDLTRAVDAYRWAYQDGLGRTTADRAGGRAGPSDPTAGVVTSTRKSRIRAAVIRAAEDLDHAGADVAAAMVRLDRIMDTGAGVRRPDTDFPRTASRADVEEAHAAAARRRARGEGFGEG